MDFQSPPSSANQEMSFHGNDGVQNSKKNINTNTFYSPEANAEARTQAPLSACESNFNSNGNCNLQLKSQTSITELDQMQRRRREEIERRNMELQSSAIMAKLKDSVPTIGDYIHDDDDEDDADEFEFHLNSSFPSFNSQSSGPMKNFSPLAHNHPGRRRRRLPVSSSRSSKRAPVPRLRIRPHRNSNEFSQEDEQAPVIILSKDEDKTEEKFGELFQSPHSNKFVLQFPMAPLQELTLDDDEFSVSEDQSGNELHYNQGDDGERERRSHQGQGQELSDSDHEDANLHWQSINITPKKFRIPISSPENYALRKVHSEGSERSHEISHLHSSPSEASTSTSPLPVKRRHYAKKKILLKPKKRLHALQGKDRRSSFDAYCSDLGSPCSSSSSSCVENISQHESSCAIPLPSFSLIGTGNKNSRSLDQMANDMNLNCVQSPVTPLHSSQGQGQGAASATAMQGCHGSDFLTLQPKNHLNSTSISTSDRIWGEKTRCNVDESGDIIMEMDPNLSISRDLESSFEQHLQQYDELNFTPLRHHRRRSVSFTYDDYCNDNPSTSAGKERTGSSSSSIQGQFQMAKQAAARWGGLGERSSSRDAIMSPSNLSDSNFRTPKPSSASPQGDRKKMGVGLFLPKLFPSASEEDLQDSGGGCTGHARGRSHSFFDMMKEAFSPAMKKSPKA